MFSQKVSVKALPLKPGAKVASAPPKPKPAKVKPLPPPVEEESPVPEEEEVPPPEEEEASGSQEPELGENVGATEDVQPVETPDVPAGPREPRQKLTPPKLTAAVPISVRLTQPKEAGNAETEVDELEKLAIELSEIIRDLGGSFEVSKCRVFVQKMMAKIGRAPNRAELTKAAQALVARI
jgi:hypothetical protein